MISGRFISARKPCVYQLARLKVNKETQDELTTGPMNSAREGGDDKLPAWADSMILPSCVSMLVQFETNTTHT